MDSSPSFFYTMIFVPIRRAAYVSLFCIDSIFKRNAQTIAVLCYHSVANDKWRFGVDAKIFMRQMNWLLAKRKPISIEDLMGHIDGSAPISEPSFLVCFDDGYQDILSIREFCLEKGIRPIVFLIAHSEKARRDELGTLRPFLSTPEIRILIDSGWSIGSHSDTHPDLQTIEGPVLVDEVSGSKKHLEQQLDLPVKYFAYPKGSHSEQVVDEVVNAGYELAFTIQNGFVTANTKRTLIPRIGIERTHSFLEFKALFSPLVNHFAAFVKEYI